MHCLNSVAPSDEELLSYALDAEELSDEARIHLEQCEICQRRLAGYQQANDFLVSHLYRSQCPGGTKLSLYCAGELSADERIRIANHLLDCPLCAAEAKDSREFLKTPLFEPIPAFAFSPRGAVRRIFTSPVKQQAQLVVRGKAVEAAWPRQCRTESFDLSLHLSRGSNDKYMLLGILTSTNPGENATAFEGVVAELYPAPGPSTQENEKEAETPLLSTEVDDLGNIVFSNVPVGEYAMFLRLPGIEVIIEGLTIISS